MSFKNIFVNKEAKVETVTERVETKSIMDINPENVKTSGIYECDNVDVISLDNIDLTFSSKNGNGFQIFKNLNFTIPDFKNTGQFVSLMGQSGCGKSTILNLISGLLKPDSGIVKIYGNEITDKTSVPMVFQQYSSYPWLNVMDNVALPLKLRAMPQKERYEKSMEYLKIVGLDSHNAKWVNELSGGQKQRVAIARALNCDSQILLLDECTSGLDIKSKNEVDDTLLNIFYDQNIDRTIINVGHNIEENVYLSNRIYILSANPCAIHKVIDIDFGCKRTPEIRKSELFHKYVDEIDSIMHEICK